MNRPGTWGADVWLTVPTETAMLLRVRPPHTARPRTQRHTESRCMRPTRKQIASVMRHRPACTAEAPPGDDPSGKPTRELDYRVFCMPRTMRISRNPPST